MNATMDTIDFETYRSARLAEGFDEVTERVWPAGAVVEAHTHPFAVKARVVQGEMWLTIGDATRHLLPGDDFELDREAPHAERYGPAGASYWAARKHG
jgi:quercetin dioxygenase-like cupin family protein